MVSISIHVKLTGRKEFIFYLINSRLEGICEWKSTLRSDVYMETELARLATQSGKCGMSLPCVFLWQIKFHLIFKTVLYFNWIDIDEETMATLSNWRWFILYAWCAYVAVLFYNNWSACQDKLELILRAVFKQESFQMVILYVILISDILEKYTLVDLYIGRRTLY